MFKTLFPVSFFNLPFRIRMIGTTFLIIPIVSYFATASEIEVSPLNFITVMKSFYDPDKIIMIQGFKISIGIVLNLMSFVVGFGILGVKKWGYFLFLLFSGLLIADGVYLLVKFGFTERFVFNLAITILPFLFILYFLNKEIATPYLTLIPRGFRRKWRIEIPVKGYLRDGLGNQLNFVTQDVSPSGCLANVDGYVAEDDKYEIHLEIESNPSWNTTATVVRSEKNDIGLKFDYSQGKENLKKELTKFLESKLLPRFAYKTSAKLTTSQKAFEAEVVNISEGGFYVATSENLSPGEEVHYQIKLFGLFFAGKSKVSWQNKTGDYFKPVGYGLAYTGRPGNLYLIIIELITFFYNFNSRER